jgi:hypothetical protein
VVVPQATMCPRYTSNLSSPLPPRPLLRSSECAHPSSSSSPLSISAVNWCSLQMLINPKPEAAPLVNSVYARTLRNTRTCPFYQRTLTHRPPHSLACVHVHHVHYARARQRLETRAPVLWIKDRKLVGRVIGESFSLRDTHAPNHTRSGIGHTSRPKPCTQRHWPHITRHIVLMCSLVKRSQAAHLAKMHCFNLRFGGVLACI